MPDSLHEIAVAADPNVVYRAWTTAAGLASWWTRQTRRSDAGYVLSFPDGKEFHFRVDDEVPGHRVRWTGVPAAKMPAQWVGTRIVVDLEPMDGGTRVLFGHIGWRADNGTYRISNSTWGALMYRLRDHCEGNGRGPLLR